jgi:DNA-binding Lrp family transcriptional regulator
MEAFLPELDSLDRRLLTLAQANFPLCPRPWEALAESLGVGEGEVLRRLERLRRVKVLRQISAIFDSRALGYHSALIAAECPLSRIEDAGALVSAHPGVSHNYQREHALNLWFTLAVPPERDMQAEARLLADRSGLLRHHVLPALKTFRVGVAFDLERGAARAVKRSAAEGRPKPPAVQLGAQDRAAVRLLQEDLPALSRPFQPLARSLGWDEAQLFDWITDAGDRGILRRYAAVLNHRQAGFGEGGMGSGRFPRRTSIRWARPWPWIPR